MRILLLISITLNVFTAFSQITQSNRIRERTYGGSNYDELNIILPSSFDGYILGGQTFSFDGDIHSGNHENGDIWIIKINKDGFPIWEKTYGGTKTDQLHDVLEYSQNEYILGGNTFSDNGDVKSGNHGKRDFWVVKVNDTGQLIWEQTYGGSNEDLMSKVNTGINGKILLSGSTSSSDGDINSGYKGGNDYWLINIDNNGSIIWEKTYGGSKDDLLAGISDFSNGGYLLAGSSNSNDGDAQSKTLGNKDFWVIKVDSNGNIIWENKYGGSEDDILTSIANDLNGGYILGGYTYSTDLDIKLGNHGQCDFWVLNIDSLGNILWEQTFGGSNEDVLNSISVANNGNIFLAGWSSSNDGNISSGEIGNKDCWIVCINSKGNLLWESTYGGTLNEELKSISAISSTTFISGGLTQSNDIDIRSDLHGNFDMWIITNSSILGGDGGGTDLSFFEYKEAEYKIYPNPTQSQLNIDFTYLPSQYELNIYDNAGQSHLYKPGNSKHEILDISELPKGIYYLNIRTVNINETRKIILN